ncbi:unnamed protein product [Scytosiphon promiscuus]
MRASAYRGARCHLGTLAKVHVVSSCRPIYAAAAPSQQDYCCRVSAGVPLEPPLPAPWTELRKSCSEGTAAVASASRRRSSRYAPYWHLGAESAAAVRGSNSMAPPKIIATALPGASTSFSRDVARRHVSTARNNASCRRNDERATRHASGGSRQAQFPSQSLLELLDISAEEAEIVRRKGGTTKTGFDNLIIAGVSSNDGGGRDRSGLDADDEIRDVSPPRSTSSCFPRFLLDELGAKPNDVKSLVLRRPVVLGWSAGAAAKVSRWLQQSLGMRRSEVVRVLLKNPEAGTKTIERNLEPKVEWLRDNLDLREEDDRGVIKILLQAPQILNLSIEKSLEPMLRWLQHRLRLSRHDAAKIARENPTLFWLSLENNAEPTLAWLRERLNIEDEGVILAMVAMAPNILSLNTRTGLEPNLVWLQDRLGLTPREVCEIVAREPTILYKSVIENLEPKLAWLKANLNLNDEAARKMFVAFPRLAGTSLGDNLKITLPWLHEALGLDAGEAVALVKRAPVLLQYSITENLDPTVAFFLVEMGASKEELRAAVLRNPKVLANSLDGRLRPRVAAMRRMKIEPVFSKHYSRVVRLSDSKFQGYLDACRR